MLQSNELLASVPIASKPTCQHGCAAREVAIGPWDQPIQANVDALLICLPPRASRPDEQSMKLILSFDDFYPLVNWDIFKTLFGVRGRPIDLKFKDDFCRTQTDLLAQRTPTE